MADLSRRECQQPAPAPDPNKFFGLLAWILSEQDRTARCIAILGVIVVPLAVTLCVLGTSTGGTHKNLLLNLLTVYGGSFVMTCLTSAGVLRWGKRRPANGKTPPATN